MSLPRLSALLPVLLGLSLTACFGSDKGDEDDDDDEASSDGGGWDLGGSEDSGSTGDDGGTDGGTDDGGTDGGTDDGGTDDGGTDSGSTGDGGTGGDTPYDGEWSGVLDLSAFAKGESFGTCVDTRASFEITDGESSSVLSCSWVDSPLEGYPADLDLTFVIDERGRIDGSAELDLLGFPVPVSIDGEAAPRALYIELYADIVKGGLPLEIDGTIEMSR